MAKLKGFKQLTGVDEALRLFFEALKPQKLEAEQVSIRDALGRVAWEDVKADSDLPSFDRSAVDGYAVQAKDTFNASTANPKTLKLAKESRIRGGEASPLWTGSPTPEGADAAVMLEYTRRLDDRIEVRAPVTPGQNVSRRGGDVKTGQTAVEAGTMLAPQHLGLLAALGHVQVNVTRKPRVGIVATGNELVEVGGKLRKGQVFEVNRLILAGACQRLGTQPSDFGIARDDLADIENRVRKGLETADLVLTTGGTSVGEADLVPAVISQMGSPGVVVHGVAMRPGMPTALAVLDGNPVIVLSGNPVAAIMGFEVFAKPLILKLLGIENLRDVKVRAKLTRHVAGVLGQRVFLRVRVFERLGELWAEPVSVKGSGVLSTVTKADGYVVVPENREGLAENESVVAQLFNL